MRSKILRLNDICFRDDKTSQIEAYIYLRDRILREHPKLYINDKRVRLNIVSDIDLISWRAKDIYFFAKEGSKVACLDVYHAAIHYLLAHKFGARLKGRPRFLLLCEAIASISDYYFDLEVLRLYGANPIVAAKAEEKVRVSLQLWGEKRAHKLVYSLMESSSEEESFAKFRSAAMGMFEYFQHLVTQDNERNGESKLDILGIYRELKKHKYAPLYHQFRLGNNIMYAKYHGGHTTQDDRDVVCDCINLLNSVNSFKDFIKAIDTPSDQSIISNAAERVIKTPRVCLVTTVRLPGASFESFLRYHLSTGFERIYVFFDDPKDSAISTAKKIKGVVPIPCDSRLRQKYKNLHNYPALGPLIKTRVEARQKLNATLGRDRALKEKFDWIFHVDCDELIYSDFNIPIGEILAQVPDNIDQVHCGNLEAVPQSMDIENPFIEVTLFKKNFGMFRNGLWKKNKFYKKHFVKEMREYFTSTRQGKAGARVRADIYPGIHGFTHKDTYQGKVEIQSKALTIETVNIKELVIYHYPISGFAHFLSKYELWSKVSDKNLGKIFDAYAVKAFRAGDFIKLKNLYINHVQFTDKAGIRGLLKAGIFIQNKKISRTITQILSLSKKCR